MAVVLTGCSTPAKKVSNVQLGMTPFEILDKMGKPSTKRAAKVFDDGQTTEVWEYTPRFLELNPRTFWIYFENNKVVQWGQPGDFTGNKNLVQEYKAVKKAQ